MFQGPGVVVPPLPPMSCGLLREEGFPTEIDDFNKDSLLWSFSRDIVLWRS